MRRDQVAAADLARQSQQIQSVAKESQNETRRLASAIDTLNGDRDRLYSRVTVLEQGLDSVTGAIARQNPAAASPQAVPHLCRDTEPQPASQNPAPGSGRGPGGDDAGENSRKAADGRRCRPEQGPATASSAGPGGLKCAGADAGNAADGVEIDDGAARCCGGKADRTRKRRPSAITAAPMPEVVASLPPADDAEADASQAAPKLAVQRTEFGVDVGGANSVGGLRALWRGLLKSRSNAALATLRPIIVVKEGSNGLGMQLRLVAGPLGDAAAAAKICAALDRKRADLRDHGVRRSTPCHEGR